MSKFASSVPSLTFPGWACAASPTWNIHRVSVFAQRNSKRSRGATLAGSANFKSLFVSQKIKGIAALDRHEKPGAANLLSNQSRHRQRSETRLFSLGKPGRRPRYLSLFFISEQTNTLGSPGALRGEMTCLTPCWAPSFKGLIIHRWVRSAAGNKSVSRTWLGKKANVTGNAEQPVFNGLSNYCESGQVDLIKATVGLPP